MANINGFFLGIRWEYSPMNIPWISRGKSSLDPLSFQAGFGQQRKSLALRKGEIGPIFLRNFYGWNWTWWICIWNCRYRNLGFWEFTSLCFIDFYTKSLFFTIHIAQSGTGRQVKPQRIPYHACNMSYSGNGFMWMNTNTILHWDILGRSRIFFGKFLGNCTRGNYLSTGYLGCPGNEIWSPDLPRYDVATGQHKPSLDHRKWWHHRFQDPHILLVDGFTPKRFRAKKGGSSSSQGWKNRNQIW